MLSNNRFIEILKQWGLNHPEEMNSPIHKSKGRRFTTSDLIIELENNTTVSEVLMDKFIESAVMNLLSISTSSL